MPYPLLTANFAHPLELKMTASALLVLSTHLEGGKASTLDLKMHLFDHVLVCKQQEKQHICFTIICLFTFRSTESPNQSLLFGCPENSMMFLFWRLLIMPLQAGNIFFIQNFCQFFGVFMDIPGT